MKKINDNNNALFIIGMVFTIIGLAEAAVVIALILSGGLFGGDEGMPVVAMVFGIQCLVFLPIGLCFWLPEQRRRIRKKRLMTGGLSYKAEITDIYYNNRLTVNGQSPLVVECSYRDRYGESYLVKSKNLWLRGYAEFDDFQAIVYVNPERPEDYYVYVTVRDRQAMDHAHDLR